MNDPMTLRIGNLSGPLLARCKETGETPSAVIRAALAKELGVDEPLMAQGFAAMSETKAAKLRKKSARVRRRRSG